METEGTAGLLSPSGEDFRLIGSSIDPEEALQEILALKPDIVVTEWELSNTTGGALMQRVRDAGGQCEFIVLTGAYSHNSLRAFFLAGGFDYWRKPLRKQMALEALERLSEGRARSQAQRAR